MTLRTLFTSLIGSTMCVCTYQTSCWSVVFFTLRDPAWVGVVLHVLVLLRQGGVDSRKVRGDRWTGVRGREEWGVGLILAIKPVSDTQSASHALAQAIVVWNLRNAFDRFTASVWVLFWTTPGDKTATREGKERRDRQGAGQGLPDEYMYFNHTLQRPASQRRMSAIIDFTQKLALSQGERKKGPVWKVQQCFFNIYWQRLVRAQLIKKKTVCVGGAEE